MNIQNQGENEKDLALNLIGWRWNLTVVWMITLCLFLPFHFIFALLTKTSLITPLPLWLYGTFTGFGVVISLPFALDMVKDAFAKKEYYLGIGGAFLSIILPAAAFYSGGKVLYELANFYGVRASHKVVWAQVLDTDYAGSRPGKCLWDCYSAIVRLPKDSHKFEIRINKGVRDHLHAQIHWGNRSQITDPFKPRQCYIKLTIEQGRGATQRAIMPSYFEKAFKVGRDIRCYDRN